MFCTLVGYQDDGLEVVWHMTYMYYFSVNGIQKTEPIVRVYRTPNTFASGDRIITHRGLVKSRTGNASGSRYYTFLIGTTTIRKLTYTEDLGGAVYNSYDFTDLGFTIQ